MIVSLMSIIQMIAYMVYANLVMLVTCILGLVIAAKLSLLSDQLIPSVSSVLAAMLVYQSQVRLSTKIVRGTKTKDCQLSAEARTECINGTSPFKTFRKNRYW